MRVMGVLVALFSLAASAQARDVPAARERVVSLGFTPADASLKALATALSDTLVTELSRGTTLDLVGPQDIATALGLERQRQLMGCNEDSNCLTEMSAALGAPWIVSGSVLRLGKTVRLDVKLVRSADGTAVFRDGRTVKSEGEVVDAVADLAYALVRQAFPSQVKERPTLVPVDDSPAPLPTTEVSPAPAAKRPSTALTVGLIVGSVVVVGGLVAGGVALSQASRPVTSKVELSW